MSLYIYESREEIPKGLQYIHCNDDFFDAKTLLQDTEVVRSILKEVESATYQTEHYFVSRLPELGGLSRTNLSTGTKTLLNIWSHPNLCFNGAECGVNAKYKLLKLSEGHVLLEHPIVLWDEEDDGEDLCDIIFKGNHYRSINDYIDAVVKEDVEDVAD